MKSLNFSDLVIKTLIKPRESGEKVYEVVHGPTGATYTLMEFSNVQSSDRLIRAVQIMKELDHPNLVKCDEMFDIEGRIYLLLEHMDRGSLVNFDVMSESRLASVANQVLSGLSYLHRKGICHGNIKLSNIFRNSKNHVKVLYLGNILSKIPMAVGTIGTFYDQFSWDVWNVGLSILKLCKDSNLIWRSMRKNSSIELWRFLICCMQTDLSKRWTADKLVIHPFVNHQGSSLDGVEHPDTMEDMDMIEDPDAIEEKGKTMYNDIHLYIPLFKGASSHEKMPISRTKRYRSSSSQMSSVASESTLSFEEEQTSPKKKNPKICVEDSNKIYDVGSSKDPTQTIFEVPFGFHNARDYCQRCISHCLLFLPDCEFDKDKLVQLWIAEECIVVEAPKRMEDVANLIFDTLVTEEVIIPSRFDNLYRQLKYKVNISKSSTRFLGQGNYLRIDEGNWDEMYGEALHLMWHCKRLDRSLSEALKNYKQLHTLMVHEDCGASIKQLPNDIFLDLKSLRTLDLSHTHILELPGTIGKLESLRYLDVSETPIKRLPESTDRLYFLQTLKLRGCIGLSALPRRLGRLINLRHLDLDIISQLKSMPSGMGQLTKLQTLQAFLVGKNEGCGIRELKNTNEITGSFCISRLENVANAEEAKEVALANKQHIEKLELRWCDPGDEDSPDTSEILEYLQPHFCLKELQITHFSGSKLPSWISNPSFINLSSITLYKCINCDILPSIGVLPSLKILHIIEMNNVRDINALFCRTHGVTTGFKSFPELEKLMLDKMLNLEEWTGIEDGDFPCLHHISIQYCPKLSVLPSISHICSLQHLEVSHCMQLVSLPEGLLPGSLESLVIRDCPKLNESCLEDGGQNRLKIAHVKNIWIDFQKVSLD